MPSPPYGVFPPTTPPGIGYGGIGYGHGRYGSGGAPRQPMSPNGGYGGQQYGYNSYGSIDMTPPRVSSALSLDGFRIEVFFSEEMRDNAALTDPASYVLADVIGVTVASVSVVGGTPGTQGGYTSVIVTHTGTTLGGTYTVTVTGPEDMAGNPMVPGSNVATFLALGDTPYFTVTPTAGDELQFEFFASTTAPQDMLTEAEFTPGIEDPTSYSITTTYPVPLTIDAISHPVGGDASKVDMEVEGMTSAAYAVAVSPADAIEYDGSILPSAATTFLGVEVGVGSSTASAPTKLLLNKNAGDLYGWDFEDITGKVIPSSSYRMDVTFDPTTATYLPSLHDAVLATVYMSDGAVQVDITIRRVAGVDVIDVNSGVFSQQVPASWSTGPTTITLLRNQKADCYAVLVNGTPLVSALTAGFTGAPTINNGVRFLLGTTYTVTGLQVSDVTVTSSQTVFTTAWNFLHGVAGSFTGSSLNANDRILTERGPLVKGWGDATPATVQDVAVRVNSTPVDVSSVNPYTGTIFPTIPIPLMPPGSIDVEIDYIWFPSPSFPMANLNTPGLILNKWNMPRGHNNPPASPVPSTALGAFDDARFPMGIVLPPMDRPQPIWIGHRYIGFERDYSALLNSPTTLLLNQSPHRVAVPGLDDECVSANVTFDGTTRPQLADDPWELQGDDTGSTVNGDGTYTVVDATMGSFATGAAAAYYRMEDLTCEGTARLAAEFIVDSYTPDGVFTGVGLGFHDNFRLYMMGLLIVNDVRHVGMLTDATSPHLVESWEMGPSATGTITDSTTITFDADEFPDSVQNGSRFQILDGSQAGVYTIAECGIDGYEGTVTVEIEGDNPFPADPGLYGNDTATVYFETSWDEQKITYQMVGTNGEDPTDRMVQLYIGSALSGEAVTLTGDEIAAIPADTSLLIRTGEDGWFFWGSLSRIATNESTWSFDRYSFAPDSLTTTMRGLVVAAEMSDPPEDDLNHEWWFTNRFGDSYIDSSGDTLLLKSTSGDASGTLDLTYGYGRLEPAFTQYVFCDCDAEFRVESGTGIADAEVLVEDDIRSVHLVTLLYKEGGAAVYRELVQLPQVSLSGLYTPPQQGWAPNVGNNLATPTARQQRFTIDKAATTDGFWTANLIPDANSSGGRIIEATVAVPSYTASGTGEVGPEWGAFVGSGSSTYDVRVTLKDGPARVVLTDATGTEHGAFNFDWTDGEYHSYRVIADPTVATATLVIDDVVQGTVALGLFGPGPGAATVRIGATGLGAESVAVYEDLSVVVMPLPSVKRTLGVLKGGAGIDPEDIDSYQIPRTDGLDVPNSDPTAVVEEMDWTSYMRVRVHLDQTWGVSIYRPDLPPPPWFTGDFATQITDPTGAWINVEYRRLPRNEGDIGGVYFGALNPESVTQQRWKQVRYRLYNVPDEDYIAPQGMVLNRYNVIHSGEYNVDVTPEVVTVTSLTSTVASVRSAHMNADRVFTVVVDGSVVPSTGWSFDEDSQTVTFVSALPADHYPVTITFAPGKPVTETYVCSQPFEASVTKLNEGTPPIPAGQTAEATRQEVFGSKLNDPSDVLNTDPDFILNDPYRFVEFTDPEGALYDGLEFCEVDDGGIEGLLHIACDGPAPEAGLIEIGLERYSDAFWVPGGPGGPWGAGSPVIKGSASSFDQLNNGILHVSGGTFVDGHLGPGTAVLYPNFPGEGEQGEYDSPAAQSGMGLNQEVKFRLEYTSAFEDDMDVVNTFGDNVPPSSPDPTTDPNPDGTPGVFLHGACAARLVDYAGAAADDRLGPWGGLSSLQTSLLGGGAQLTGDELTLNGGAQIPGPTTTDFQIEAAN